MGEDHRGSWELRHRRRVDLPEPARVVLENVHLLPRSGTALDLASGLGSNALLFAARGLETHAWDFSQVALQRLHTRAATRGLRVSTECRDVITAPPLSDSFDLICVSHFLERTLAPALVAALRPGGLLCYQSFARNRPPSCGHGPGNPQYLLDRNELLHLFVPPLQLLVYREEDLAGDRHAGWRGMAMLVACKAVATGEDSE
jgi:SAM-dependent methyltransferase